MKKFVLLLIFLSVPLFSKDICNLEFSTQSLDFGEVFAGETATKELVLMNNNSKFGKIIVEDIKLLSQFEGFSFTTNYPVSISKSESYSIIFKFSQKQNITCNATVFFSIKCGNNKYSIPVNLKAKSVFKDAIYSFTQDLWEDSLRTSLSEFVKKHTSFNYSDARTLMWSKLDRLNGQVECVYTGKTTYVTDDPNFSELDQLGWNTEHTWPQAYGAQNDPERSDLFHIFITDKKANEKRANYPFGFVKSSITWQEGGSKLGKDESGTIIFEPRDVHKGNVARGLMYFAIKYGNKSDFLTSQEINLREYLKLDPPDEREKTKNDSIFAYQKNRNPFIDHQELVERIPSIAKGGLFPRKINLSVIDTLISLELKETSDSVSVPLYFYNSGNTKINNVELTSSVNGNDFVISTDKANLQDFHRNSSVNLIVKGKASNSTIGKISVLNKDDNQQYNITVKAQNTTGISDDSDQ